MRRALTLLCLCLAACMDGGVESEELFDFGEGGLFVVNEGNFMAGNATLSYYDPLAKTVENEVFFRANSMRLGDVAQSMTVHGGVGWIVVDNSGVIWAVDPRTMRVLGHITGFGSPRYIHFVSDTKAYVTDLHDPRIAIVDPRTRRITGHIDTRGHSSTEQMVGHGRYVYTNCWSYDNVVLVVDTATDEVVAEIEVGRQPTSLALDANGRLWVLTDGGVSEGRETPRLCRVGTATWEVERTFSFAADASPSELCVHGDRLYFLDGGVRRMDVAADALPAEPLIPAGDGIFYGLTVDPASGEVYVADAVDYSQRGVVYRFSPDGTLLDSFEAGIIPGGFCFW